MPHRSRRQLKDEESPSGLFFRMAGNEDEIRSADRLDYRKGYNHAKGNEEIQVEDV